MGLSQPTNHLKLFGIKVSQIQSGGEGQRAGLGFETSLVTNGLNWDQSVLTYLDQ